MANFLKTTTAVLMLIFINIEAKSQPQNVQTPVEIEFLMSSPTANYDSICAYYEGVYSNYSDTTESGNYMKYLRWKSFWQTRAGRSTDSTSSFDEALEKYGTLLDYSVCGATASNNSYWSQIGPYEDVQQGVKMNRGFVSAVAKVPGSSVAFAGSNAGGLWKTNNIDIANPTWINLTNTTNLPGLSINDIAIHPSNPNILFLATGHTSHYGEGYGIGVLRSIDGGATWERKSPIEPSKNAVCKRVIVDHSSSGSLSGTSVYAIIGTMFYKSIDGGEIWSEHDLNLPQDTDSYNPNAPTRLVYDMEQHPTDSNILYVSSKASSNSINEGSNGAVILVSTDGGETWLPSEPQGFAGTFSTSISIAVSIAQPNSVWIIFKDTDESKVRIYKSANSGSTWTLIFEKNLASFGGGLNQFVVSPTDPNHMYFGGIRMHRVIKPTTFLFEGHSQISGYLHADVRSLIFLTGSPVGSSINQDRLMVGTDGGIGITHDGGTTSWQNKNGNFSSQLVHGFGVSNFYGIWNTPNEADRIVAGNQDNGQKVYDGNTWYFGNSTSYGDGGGSWADITNPDIVYSQVFSGDTPMRLRKFKKNYQNNSWPQQGSMTAFPEVGSVQLQIQQSVNGNLYAAWENVYKYDDPVSGVLNNNNLIQISDFEGQFGTGNDGSIEGMALSDYDDDVIFALKSGPTYDDPSNSIPSKSLLFKTTSGGGINQNNWDDLTPNLPDVVWRYLAMKCIDTDGSNHDKVWIGLGGFAADDNLPGIYNGIYRVILSEDGGDTWNDYSNNLPPFPVNDIVYEPGSNGGVYAATDVGVFYTNNAIYPTDGWVCYGNLLPTNIINDIEINPCNRTLYASVYGQGLWKTPLYSTTAQSSEITIDQNLTIDEPNIYSSSIVIDPGVTLTIAPGVQLSFMPGTKIMVKRGGKLICDGCTLTNYCGDFWEGIEVWGDKNSHQNVVGGAYLQGLAVFKNNATIMNARNGVKNWKPGDYNSTGGIILADNSNFTNCWRGAEFISYQNTASNNSSILRGEKSHFYKCTFEINDDYIFNVNALPPYACITMWRTDRLKIEGCDFLNTSSAIVTENRSVAIYSHDANYLVKEHCNDIAPPIGGCTDETNCTFTGWHKAIEAKETAAFRPIMVRNSYFTENMIGVELRGADYSEIYWNEFDLGNHPFEKIDVDFEVWQNHIGVFTNETRHFTITENKFQEAQNPIYDGNGVLVYNSGANYNRVYNNEYNELATGTNGWQVNRNNAPDNKLPIGMIGLEYICNENQGNKVDFQVSRLLGDLQDEYDLSGIRYTQGEYNSPAGSILGNVSASNLFSNSNLEGTPDQFPDIYTHFTIDSEFNYLYVRDNPIKPSVSEITPGKMNLITTPTSNTCPLQYGEEQHTGGKIVELNQQITEFAGLQYVYSQTIDNGNTQGMVNEILVSWPNDAWDLRDELLARSPYNSEEVLIEIVQKEIMPHAMLLEVLIANPDALRSGEVIKTVETSLVNPMPQNMIDLLYASADEKTFRTTLEGSMSAAFAKVDVLQKEALSQKAFLTDKDEPDSTLYLLSRLHTAGINYNVAFAMAERGMFTQAYNLLDSTRTNYKMNQIEYDECNGLMTLLNLLQVVDGSGRTIANMDSSQIVSMQQIAEGATAGLAASKAQNALCFHYGICYDNSGTPKNNIPTKKPRIIDKDELINQINTSTVYPVPADGYITISYSLMKAKENTTLNVYDNIARLVYTKKLGENYDGEILIDTRKFSNGIYVYNITQDDHTVESNKFIITH